jgi:uncharacterized membrane protein YdjX (TVP38/TMEM64 family)
MPEPSPVTPLSRKIARVVVALVLVTAFGFALRWVKGSGLLERALEWIRALGPWAPVVFMAVYLMAVVVFLPASILTVGGGFVFGMFWGSVYVLIAATISANLTFIIARYLARDWIAHKVASHPKFKAIDDAVAREGWKVVALVRLAPIFPFSITSYAFGLTRIPLRHYFFANFTMVPPTLMYVYFGAVLSDLTQHVEKPPWVKWAVGAVTVVVMLYLTRFAKRALSQKIS